jgi:hypothetical protein
VVVGGQRVEVKKNLDFNLLYEMSFTIVGGDRVEVR